MSPDVWNDAKPRIAAAAATQSCAVQYPNERLDAPQNISGDGDITLLPFIAIDFEGIVTEPVELKGGVWQENGTIWIHVMVPVATGIDAGLAIRKAMSNAFRSVSDAALGVVYRDGQRIDPLGSPTDDGQYRPLSIGVNYIYYDRPD